MPTDIDAQGLIDLRASGPIQLLEVLPAREYVEEHLPGSINIPLKTLTHDRVAKLDVDVPTVVYCWDDT